MLVVGTVSMTVVNAGVGDSVKDCGCCCWRGGFWCWLLKGCKVRLILPNYPIRVPPGSMRRMLSADSIQWL